MRSRAVMAVLPLWTEKVCRLGKYPHSTRPWCHFPAMLAEELAKPLGAALRRAAAVGKVHGCVHQFVPQESGDTA